MKIFHTSIFAMSQDRSFVIAKMNQEAPVICEHIAKCILWKKSYWSFDDWIKEITSHINRIARIKCTSKLKYSTYRSNLFNQMGTNYYDALNILWDVYEDCLDDDDPYPEVDITNEDGINMFKCYNEIADNVSKYLATHKIIQGNHHYDKEIRPIVEPTLIKYC